jgi:hypothetical protein
VLIEKWHPVTRDVGLIEAPVDVVTSAFDDWQRGLGIEHSRRRLASLADALEALPPLSAELRRSLFVPTRSHWTAFLASGIAGSDPTSTIRSLAAKLGVRAMRVCATPDGFRWPGVTWEVRAPAHLGGDADGHRRTLYALDDGGRWDFASEGEPFAFEDCTRYAAPRKRDRFTRPRLAAYLAEFGLFPFDDDFYDASDANPAWLLERQSRWRNPPPEFTLEQAVERTFR